MITTLYVDPCLTSTVVLASDEYR